MRRLFAFLTLAFLLAGSAWGQSLGEIITGLSLITGFKATTEVPRENMEREELQAFLEKRMGEMLDPDELRFEELALKKLGLAPPDFNLKESVVSLMTEQAAAFYDYRENKMVMLSGSAGPMLELVLVHEAAHALADQSFELEDYVKGAKDDDDATLARQAVMEGQAQWLMSEYTMQKIGQSLLKSPGLVRLMSSASDMASGQFPVFDKAPLYLRESLLFPYLEGMKFQQEVVAKMGKEGFAEVYRRPPTGTQQILHPELYLEPVPPPEPIDWEKQGFMDEIEGDGAGQMWMKAYDGTLGEFDHSVLLKIYDSDEADLAAAVRGGVFRLYENSDESKTALAYASRWATPEEAGRFLAAYRKVLAGKLGPLELTTDQPNRIAGTAGDARIEVWRDGDLVVSTEGLDGVRLVP